MFTLMKFKGHHIKSENTGWSFECLHRIFSLTYNIKPPPKRLRSRLKTL